MAAKRSRRGNPASSDLRAAKEEWSSRLITPAPRTAVDRHVIAASSARPADNVVGVGIGEKLVDENSSGILCVKFFVRTKLAPSQLSPRDKLPGAIDGVPTDVEEVGVFHKFATRTRRRRARRAAQAAMPNPKARIRPAQPGCSIGFQDPANQFTMAGTFGAVVRKGRQRYVLSNNHVLADENKLAAGAAIFQPGLLDGGNTATDQIATLSQFVRLQANRNNRVDCAIALASPQSVISPSILHIGPPKGIKASALDMVVHKFGRTTSYRAGRVTSIDTDVKVQYDLGTLTFTGQIIVQGLSNQAFSGAGDSGSLIVERSSNLAVGLLFAGSTTHTIANHIQDVLAQFGGITLVTG